VGEPPTRQFALSACGQAGRGPGPMNRETVLAEWRRARQSLRAAQVLTAEQCPEDAVSRAYYAILHGAKAALYVHDVAVASHAGARRMAAEITGGHASQVDLPVAVHGSVANLRDFMEYREARRAQQTGLDFSVFLPLARGG